MYQSEDQRFDNVIRDAVVNTEYEEPRTVVPGRPTKTREDRIQEQEWLGLMRECYQFMDRDEFIESGIPMKLVDDFLRKL